MEDRLAPLYLLHPPASTPWAGTPGQTLTSKIKRQDADPLLLQLPLFWYDPPWSEVPTELGDELALAVSNHNVLVSAMRSDLSGPESESRFHQPWKPESEDETADNEQKESGDEKYFPRIVPYRPERYGLSDRDFDDAMVIDVRLMMSRDKSGRFAYSPEQIARWEGIQSESVGNASWIPAATFPPDVESFEHLASKLNQLRQLAPSAAIFTSIGPFRMEEEIAPAIAADPDGLIVRFDEVSLEPLQLAALTRRARQLVNHANQGRRRRVPLWIVPGEITPDDAIKMIALGTDAIGIDAWCNPLLEESQQDSGHYGQRVNIDEITYDALADRIERFSGLYLSLQRVPAKDRLGSFSATWARTLAVRALR